MTLCGFARSQSLQALFDLMRHDWSTTAAATDKWLLKSLWADSVGKKANEVVY